MTKEEIAILAEKVKMGTATKEETLVVFKELNKILSDISEIIKE